MDYEKLEKHTLLIGFNDKDTKKQIIKSSRAKSLIAQVCGDCTISDCMGVYTHDNGVRVKEKSVKVEMLFKNDSDVDEYAKALKKILNQAEIYIVKDFIMSKAV